MNRPLPVQAVLTTAEHAALRSALARLGAQLHLPVALDVADGVADVTDRPSFVVTSLLPQVDDFATPWQQAERRLRDSYAALCSGGSATICVCTVFRHVAPDAEQPARLLRIRQLNLLAARLSQELGLIVVDLDRALADSGARALATDYRLGGEYAMAAAAKCMALSLLAAGLDDYASFAVQDAAKAAIAAYQPPVAVPSAAVEFIARWDLMAVGSGRRRQRASVVIDSVAENQVGALLRMVLRRQMSPAEVATKLVTAIGQRGLRGTAAVLASGINRMVRSRLKVAR